MKTPIEHLEQRIEEMNKAIQHVIMTQRPDGFTCAFFERDKKRDIAKIESEIAGYKTAIRILKQDSEFVSHFKTENDEEIC